MQKLRVMRRPRVVEMCFAVKRLEMVRDKLNPDLAVTRSVDANLDALRAWRQSSAVLRKGAK